VANILIVEDDELLSNAYKLILEKNGHSVATALNGAEGLKQAAITKPEIILLDILMPEVDGLEFLQRYDIRGKHPLVSVVILSNIGDEARVQKAMALGAYKYLVKAHAKPQELSMIVSHLIDKNLSKVAPKT